MNRRQTGFTLVELMVAVAILAILSRIAYVSYTKQVIKSNRTDAEQMLLQIAQAEERFYATHDYYRGNSTSIGITSGSSVPQTPASPAAAIYQMTFTPTGISSTAYLITATPVLGKINRPNSSSTDGTLTLDQTGAKCWYKSGGSTCQAWNSN